jgi:hypothetical protein
VKDPQGWNQADHVEDESPLAPTLEDYADALVDAAAAVLDARLRSMTALAVALARLERTLHDYRQYVREYL